MDRVLASKGELKAYSEGRRYFMPRTQAEAGIANMAWDHRLPPLQSWTKLVLVGLGYGVAGFVAYVALRFIFQ